MTPPETVSTTASGDAHATAPLTCTFGPQGPTLEDLIDAYLQDYQVRQFRSHSTARGRTAHLAAFFGRAARAAGLTTHQIRQYQLARRAGEAAVSKTERPTPLRIASVGHGGAPFGEEISTYRTPPPNRWYGQTA